MIKSLLTAFARNRVFANILLVMILVGGVIASTAMIRENFPEFSLDMITVTVPYPGADPEEVEEGISRKIEEAVEDIEGIKQYTTDSGENVATAMLEVEEDYEVGEVLEEVRTEINAISTFPVDAEKPVISELTLEDTVIMLNFSADMSERRIKEWSERIKDEIKQLPEVSRATVFGTRDYEINIELSEERLRQYGLTLNQVVRAVRDSSLNLAGGTIRTKGQEIRLRTLGRKYTGEELAQVVVLAGPGGEIVTLDRLARIRDGFTEDPIRSRINGQPSVLINVLKTKEEDALVIADAVKGYVEQKQQEFPDLIKLEVLYDNTDMLRARINLLLKNGLIGICIVFFLLWLFLNGRLSFWSGMGIPISIAGAMIILWFQGGTVNMISLFGLIMVLGIVVDDAIVVGESIFVHRKRGLPPIKAAVEGVVEVGMPVTAAVITTIVAFTPLLYVGGIMGKFISILPVVVIACLLISLVECLILLPAHLNDLPDLQAGQSPKGFVSGRLHRFHQSIGSGLEWIVERVYRPFLQKAIRWRYISMCTAFSVLFLTIGLLQGGILKFEIFPDIDGFVITSVVKFPEGTPVEVTQEAVDRVEASLLRLQGQTDTRSGEPLIESRLALVGRTLQEIPESGPNVGSVQAILLPSEKRGIHSQDLMVAWEKEIGTIPGVKSLTFEGLQAGPPGAPIEVWIQGYEMDSILSAADELRQRLQEFDGVYQIRSDFSPGKQEIRLELKPEARTLGLTVSDLAGQIQAGYYGEEALRLQRGEHDIRVKIRYTEQERSSLSSLDEVRIRTAGGQEVPLLSVAEVSFGPGYSTITRTDGMRRVAVSADVDSKRANANEVFAVLSTDFFPDLQQKYPGIYVALQGEKKKMRESFGSLYMGFPLAVFGIFIIIATMFRSYIQPFIVLFTVPFGIIGAVAGHLLMGFDLSLMSIFGMVALTGVVVNDAIVLIERINENLAQDMSFFDAILHGGARRFRPIFLTSLSTIGGLAPLILETDLQARFLIPMALSLAAGVAFATVLTLVLIPSLLTILNDLRLVLFRIRRQTWPSREEVEPAASRHQREEDLQVGGRKETPGW
ncbi:MAG: efflux RND transporter permease subunit [Desulfohalobiaceae bacterium]|nr:efflux RND transporter permease subunit [Desulfohalobiaceae bacterium]